MSVPLVSVIVPTRNRASLLPRAMSSILAQSHGDLELIVVDDASDGDDTRTLVEGWCDRDARVRYLRHATRGGVAKARNSALAIACGHYVAFLDDDDEWLPAKLVRQLALFEQAGKSCVLVGGGLLRYVAGQGSRVYGWPMRDGEIWVDEARFIDSTSAHIQTAVVRADALRAVGGFDVETPVSEDYELCLRLLRKGRFAALPDIVTMSYEQTGALSRHWPSRVVANPRILSTHTDLLRQHPRAVDKLCYELAVGAGLLGQRRQAWRAWRQAFAIRPRPLRVWLLPPVLLLGSTALRVWIGLAEAIKAFRRHPLFGKVGTDP